MSILSSQQTLSPAGGKEFKSQVNMVLFRSVSVSLFLTTGNWFIITSLIAVLWMQRCLSAGFEESKLMKLHAGSKEASSVPPNGCHFLQPEERAMRQAETPSVRMMFLLCVDSHQKPRWGFAQWNGVLEWITKWLLWGILPLGISFLFCLTTALPHLSLFL